MTSASAQCTSVEAVSLEICPPSLKLGPADTSLGAFSTGHAATQEQMKFSCFSKTSQETSPWHQASRAAECFRLGPRGGQLRRARAEQGLGLEDTLLGTSIFLNYILGQKPQMEKPQGKSHRGEGETKRQRRTSSGRRGHLKRD